MGGRHSDGECWVGVSNADWSGSRDRNGGGVDINDKEVGRNTLAEGGHGMKNDRAWVDCPRLRARLVVPTMVLTHSIVRTRVGRCVS